MELSFDINEIVAVLNKSPHRDLNEYAPIVAKAALDPHFFHHFIAWNALNGQIRDAQVALPVLGLEVTDDPELVGNSYGHLLKLSPRDLLRGLDFAKARKATQSRISLRGLGRMVEAYLRKRERNREWFERTALQHRRTLRKLYSRYHIKPSPLAAAVLDFKLGDEKQSLPSGSVFEVLKRIPNMDPVEAAGTVMLNNIPFLIATGVMPAIKGNRAAIIAAIQGMSPSDLVNQVKTLNHWGMDKDPAIQAAYAEALRKKPNARANLFKATKAVEELQDEEETKEVLRKVQEAKLGAGTIDGDWAVLADASSSMRLSIELGKKIASLLSRMVKGKVLLNFFNSRALGYDVTGKALHEIQEATAHVFASGYTSIGAGLDPLLVLRKPVDGIAMITDGGHNTFPQFSSVYRAYEEKLKVSPTLYYYHVQGDPDKLSPELRGAGIPFEYFEVPSDADEYSLANLVQTMRVNRYSLYQEIMDTPLRKFTL